MQEAWEWGYGGVCKHLHFSTKVVVCTIVSVVKEVNWCVDQHLKVSMTQEAFG